MKKIITPQDMRNAARFAEKCFGHRINLIASQEVVRYAVSGRFHERNQKHNSPFLRIIKQIAIAYREVMDL